MTPSLCIKIIHLKGKQGLILWSRFINMNCCRSCLPSYVNSNPLRESFSILWSCPTWFWVAFHSTRKILKQGLMESEPFNWKFREIQINNPKKREIFGKKFRYTLQGVYPFPNSARCWSTNLWKLFSSNGKCPEAEKSFLTYNLFF